MNKELAKLGFIIAGIGEKIYKLWRPLNLRFPYPFSHCMILARRHFELPGPHCNKISISDIKLYFLGLAGILMDNKDNGR